MVSHWTLLVDNNTYQYTDNVLHLHRPQCSWRTICPSVSRT